jgi:hypothetical protein
MAKTENKNEEGGELALPKNSLAPFPKTAALIARCLLGLSERKAKAT